MPTPVTTPAPTPAPLTSDNFNELYVATAHTVQVSVSETVRSTTTVPVFKTPQNFLAGFDNIVDITTCGSRDYLYIADAGTSSRGGTLSRVRINRPAPGEIVAGQKTIMYGSPTDTSRSVTAVTCGGSANDLYFADAKKGKIKRVTGSDLRLNKGLDGDDYLGDECDDAVDDITALTFHGNYLYWSVLDENPSDGIWRKNVRNTLKDGKCTECFGAKSEKNIPAGCSAGKELEFFKQTEDGVQALIVYNNDVVYSKGNDEIKKAGRASASSLNPSTTSFKKGYTSVVSLGMKSGRYAGGSGLIVVDKRGGKVDMLTNTGSKVWASISVSSPQAAEFIGGTDFNTATKQIISFAVIAIVAIASLL